MDMMHRRRMMMTAEAETLWKYVGNQKETKYTTFANGESLVNATEWHIYGSISGGYIQFRFPKAGQWQSLRVPRDDSTSDFTNGDLDIIITFQSPTTYIVNGTAGTYTFTDRQFTLSAGTYGGFLINRGGSAGGSVEVYAK